MAGLLVSVRSGVEARRAAAGGATVIDVKEPDAGALGRASAAVWREVRRAVPPSVPVSVALGELSEWRDGRGPALGPEDFEGLAFCKIGLADAGPDWREAWRALRDRLPTGGCRWVAVAYADWESAAAPRPGDVLTAASAVADAAGVLIDTFDKARPARLDDGWLPWTRRVRAAGLKLAIAGGLNAETIGGLSRFAPDLVAVRGAACADGDRRGEVDERRVSELAAIVRGLSAGYDGSRSNRTPWASGT